MRISGVIILHGLRQIEWNIYLEWGENLRDTLKNAHSKLCQLNPFPHLFFPLSCPLSRPLSSWYHLQTDDLWRWPNHDIQKQKGTRMVCWEKLTTMKIHTYMYVSDQQFPFIRPRRIMHIRSHFYRGTAHLWTYGEWQTQVINPPSICLPNGARSLRLLTPFWLCVKLNSV